MSPAHPAKSLNDLLARLADGELSEQEAVALEILLQQSAENRAHYRTFLAVHQALQESFQSDAETPFPIPARRARSWGWIAAAAAVVLATAAVWHALLPHGTPPVAGKPATAPTTKPVLAVVAAAEGVEWNLPCPADAGTQLPAGPANLTKGELVLTLANGQTVSLRGPASFNLVSEREVDFLSGVIGVKQEPSQGIFVVRLPKGAVVCSSAEYSIHTRSDGVSSLFVFSGTTSASTVDRNGRSREEAVVVKGGSLDISERLVRCSLPGGDFSRVPRPLPTHESVADQSYADAVAADSPVASWRFEETDAKGSVRPTHGSQPLDLRENATLAGPPGRRFLAVDDNRRRGFAYTAGPAVPLTREGFTVECLVFSATESYSSAVILESATTPPPTKGSIHHAPQICAIERMGRMGEKIGHIHPDYALRSVLRFPAGYEGGTNVYSSKSHLLHAWHHAALTYDGSVMRLYLDGLPTDEAATISQWTGDTVRVVVGRLQPMPQDELRQWIGGIDEVAIYPRPLPPDAILRHSQALRRR
ncbi:MAG: LamG domain-containing protein [Verrucomicrobia bacterium]|nr:LamG domain-containing protein [Verrucomicrobiota bacterium]